MVRNKLVVVYVAFYVISNETMLVLLLHVSLLLSFPLPTAMCDVTRHNFEVYVPRLQELARVSSFVSVDTEFTALCLGKENRPR